MFDKLIKKYKLTKTLRFELVPIDDTKNLFDNNGKNILQQIVEKDQKIDTWYNTEMKPLFDDLHEKFITESLSNTRFEGEILEYLKDIQRLGSNLREYNNILRDLKKDLLDDNNKKKIKEINEEISNFRKNIIDRQQKIRDYIVQQFNNTAKLWKQKYDGIEIPLENKLENNKTKKIKIKIKIKKDNYEILNEKSILDLLICFYREKANIIKEFNKFFTYFIGFNENRKNYYSSEAKSTSIANRIVNINFSIFLNNIHKYNEILNELNNDEYLDILRSYNNIFEIENYHDFITQNGIENYNDKISEIKSILNEYNQKVLNNSKSQIYNFEKLQKQIGCKTKQQIGNNSKDIEDKYLEKVGLGIQVKTDENGHYMIWEAINDLNKNLIDNNLLIDLRENYKNFFDNYNNYDLSKIWFRKEAINTISAKWFGADNWSLIRDALKQINMIDDKIKHENVIDSFINLHDIKIAFDLLESGINFDIKNKRKNKNSNSDNTLIKYTAENLFKKNILDNLKNNNINITNKSIFEVFMLVWKNEIDFKFKQIFDGYITEKGNKVEAFLNEYKRYSQEKFDKDKKDEHNRYIHLITVKNLIEEGYLSLFQLTKYHSLLKNNEQVMLDTEPKFYDTLNKFWDNNKIVLYHKALQATLTKKPYSIDKIKLNFDNSNFLQGWSDGQEINKSGVIIKKDNDIYIGILHNRNLFKNNKEIYENADNSNIQRLILKNLHLKTVLGKGFKSYYNTKYSELNSIEAINKAKEYIKEKYVNKYPQLNEILNKSYNDKKEFNNDLKSILNECYEMKFRNVNEKVFYEACRSGKLYLFKIKNKDIKKQNKNTKNNIHTEYWNYLFSDKNFDNTNITLNAGAKIFFRKEQKDKLKKKKDKQGKEILDAKRYGEDKYFFHVPITINYSLPQIDPNEFNKEVNSLISSKKDNTFYIIGVDRGEKHLMYYSIVEVQFDDNNEIKNYKMIDQGSLNKIQVPQEVDEKVIKYKYNDESDWLDVYNPLKKDEWIDIKLESTGKKVNYVDYHLILDFYEKKRILARKSWETIGKIKDIKEGYISQVIHKLYNLIIKYNAIIVMENLNTEFKIKRTAKVEKSVYKKFELALAKKLNHLVLKDKKLDELGSVLNAYQLTPYIEAGKVNKFEKARQWGIIFYVSPNYTSSIDPLTGWRKHLYYSNSENIQRIKKIFCGKDAEIKIDFDQKHNCFKFTYEYNDNTWQLFAHQDLDRYYWDITTKSNKHYKLYTEFEQLFNGLDKNKNINEQLENIEQFDWSRLIFLWNLLNQIRNVDKESDDDNSDFIQSPVYSDKYGCFFDSRKVQDINLPKNGDANGAYNIAKKGIIILQRIKQNIDNIDYTIKDDDWEKFCIKNN